MRAPGMTNNLLHYTACGFARRVWAFKQQVHPYFLDPIALKTSNNLGEALLYSRGHRA